MTTDSLLLDSENRYIENSYLLGLVLVIRTVNYQIDPLPFLLPITITFIAYQTRLYTTKRAVIFHNKHIFPKQFFSVTLPLASYWCLSL